MVFSKDGKRLFQTFADTGVVEQYSLNNPFDLSSSTKEGEFDLSTLDTDLNSHLNAVTFSSNGTKFFAVQREDEKVFEYTCLLYTSPSPRDAESSRMPSSA